MINESMSYADIPIDLIQSELGMTAEDGLLFDVYVQIHANNALNGLLIEPNGTSIRYRQILPNKDKSLFGLHFEIMEDVFDEKRNLRLVVTYRLDRYSRPLIHALFAEINRIFALINVYDAAEKKLEELSTTSQSLEKHYESGD